LSCDDMVCLGSMLSIVRWRDPKCNSNYHKKGKRPVSPIISKWYLQRIPVHHSAQHNPCTLQSFRLDHVVDMHRDLWRWNATAI